MKRYLFRLLICALLFGTLLIPGKADGKSNNKVRSVTIVKPRKSAYSLKMGSKLRLNVKVKPANSAKTRLRFTSSKPKVASVTAKGVIKAKKTGTARITVKAVGNSKAYDSIKIKVVKKAEAKNSAADNSTTHSNNQQLTNLSASQPVNSYPAANTNQTSENHPAVTDSPVPSLPDGDFTIASAGETAQLYLDSDSAEYEGLNLVSQCFTNDVLNVTDSEMNITTDPSNMGKSVIIVGSVGNNDMIDSLVSEGKLNVDDIKGKWEVYKIDVIQKPFAGVDKALVIAGSDKRGAIYGLFSISEQMGVSPWEYWADVTPAKKDSVVFRYSALRTTSKEPSVRYRGIFLNDEEPALGTWVNKFKQSKGGKFNELFYEKVFQLLLRLKANYMWPAMWGSSFGAEGAECPEASAILADKYGIVMGTSHHEPMMISHKDWTSNKSKYGNGEWDWVTNEDGLRDFFTYGAENFGQYDNIATIGMRGDGDATMLPEGSSIDDNVSLLKQIITAQKDILSAHDLENKPKMIALYKEVEEYWYGDANSSNLKEWDGLDDTIVLLAEDNYGNLRTLPTEDVRERTGGWGMYYHFDYNGAPASYQWTQTFQLQKVWEQMSMAYDYGVDDIWIVNVGDLKPMEMPISFFLDMAYDFDSWGTANKVSATEYEDSWLNEQFGTCLNPDEINELSEILDDYTRITTLRKQEIVTTSTFSLDNYNEAVRILDTIRSIKERADYYKDIIPEDKQAAYYQLVYYPAVATTNIYKIQIYSALNKAYANQKLASANLYGTLMEDAIAFDKELENTYSTDMPGGVGDKWHGMADQAVNAAHIGYSSWRPQGSYPTAQYITVPSTSSMSVGIQGLTKTYTSGTVTMPEFTNINKENYYVNVLNGGSYSFDYSVSASEYWIKLTKTSGKVNRQDTFGISVDFDKLAAGSAGDASGDATAVVTITGNSQTVTLNVTAKTIDTTGLEPMTFVEAHNYISIEASHFSGSGTGTEDSAWTEIIDYGRTLSSMKVFPTTMKFTNDTDAPYLEYKIHTGKTQKYTLQTHIAPSNNVDWNDVRMRLALSVDGQDLIYVNTVPDKYVAGTWQDSVWSNAVRDNIRSIDQALGYLSEGEHTIRIYAIDPAIVLEKLIVYPDANKLKTSYLGPQESYYAGKEVESRLIADIQQD